MSCIAKHVGLGIRIHAVSMTAVLVVSLLLHGCSGGGSGAESTPTETLSGYVVDDAVAGAKVEISDVSSGEVLGEGETDAEGYYEIEVPEADVYHVKSSGGTINGGEFLGELRAICGDERLNTCYVTPLTTLAELAALADSNRGMVQAYAHAQANHRALLGLTDEDPFITDYFRNMDSTVKSGNPHSDMTLGDGNPFNDFTPGSGNPHSDLPRKKGNPHSQTPTGNNKPHSALDLVRLRARIGNGEDFDSLLRAILDDLADGTFDGDYAEPDVISPEELLQRAEAILQGDPSMPQTPDAELEEILAPSHTPEAQARQRRLEHNHNLILHATDPEPSWISTRATTEMLITSPGESHSVDLFKLDAAGNVLGPVDKSKLRIELRIQRDETTIDYIPAEFQGDYIGWDEVTAGRLNINVPVNMNRGRLIIGVRPDFGDAGQLAIAERWSVPILVDVWPLKPNVTKVEEAAVYYPVGADAHYRTGSSFDSQKVAEARYQAGLDETLQGQLLKALVVKGMSLQQGQLLDYRLPDTTGGFYPLGGRVVKVINGADDQQLVLLNFDILEVYDVMTGSDDQFVKEGVMPEFVTFRSGGALSVQGTDEEEVPLSYFGPEERSTIQANDFELFGFECAKGSGAMAVTPFIKFDTDHGVDAGVTYSVGANGADVACTLASYDGTEITVPLGGPIGYLLKKLTGTGVTLSPYGKVKLGISAGTGFTNFSVVGGYSFVKGLTPPKLGWNGSLESGLEAVPATAKGTLGGELGMKATVSAFKISSWLGDYDVSLSSSLGWYTGFVAEALNAAASKDGKNSSIGTEFGIKFGVEASDGLISLLRYLGARGTFKVTYSATAVKKIDAEYKLHDVYDFPGEGRAYAHLQPGSELVRDFTTSSGSSDGYASLEGSSVYNDPHNDITYDLAECEANGGKIITPLIGCLNGFFCGQVDEPAKLCGAQLYVDPISASGFEGETVSAWGNVGVMAGINPNALTVSVSGSPLRPTTTSFQLRPGEAEGFYATATCSSTGVIRGTITASAGSENQETRENLLTCKCDSSKKDCDRTWASPHLITADGLAYDYIASGDYILQQVVDDTGEPVYGLEVQARYLPGYDVSWPQAAAMQVGDDVVEVYTGHFSPPGSEFAGYQNILYVKVNGQLQGPPHQWHAIKNDSRIIELPSGGLIFFEDFVGRNGGQTWDPRALTVVWPSGIGLDGYGVELSTPYYEGYHVQESSILAQLEIQLIRPSTHTGHERGMLGNNDGDPSNDFMRRNGEVLGQDTAMSWTALYGLFGGDWLVKPHECLFSDGCLTKPDFPTSAAVLTPEQRALGESACANLIGYYKEACVHDVGLSGSIELVQGYYANSDDLNWMATQLQTPGVELPVYMLSRGSREALLEGTAVNSAYLRRVFVTHLMGEGKFLLSLRPPRGASAAFSSGQPGALNQHLTGEGDLSTSVDVHCDQPDPDWAELGEAWARDGAIQLWVLDPLSGFASRMVDEIPLVCTPVDAQVLAAGDRHTVALDATGQMWAWGENNYGQLGDGTTKNHSTPGTVADLSALQGAMVVSVEAGTNHNLALDIAGRLWAWGANNYGQLGDGSVTSHVTTPAAVDLSALQGASVASVAAGANHNLVLDDAGRLWAWGEGASGQLGDGATVNHTTPSLVDLSALQGAAVVSVAAGSTHNHALDDAGRLWAWGGGAFGQLGDGTTVNHTTPSLVDLTALQATVVSVAAGANHSLALDDAGRLWAWGANYFGQLGDGTSSTRTTPVKIDLSVLHRVISVTAGREHTVVLDEVGGLWAWGGNAYGQLGDGTTINRSTPAPVDLSALDGAEVVSVAAGTYHTFALDEVGRLWAWGGNAYGQLGDGTNINRSTPVLVAALDGGFYEVSAGDLPATVNITEGYTTELGTLNVKSWYLSDLTLQVSDADFSLGVRGETSAVAPFGESAHTLYLHCDAPGRQVKSYRLLDNTGNLAYSGEIEVNCLANIRQSISLDGDGGLMLGLINAGKSDAWLRFTPSEGGALSGMASWEGSLAQLDRQSLSLTGMACPFGGVFEVGVLDYLDNEGRVYAQKMVKISGTICNANLAVGSIHSLALTETGRLWGWGDNSAGQLGDGTTTDHSTPVAVDRGDIEGAKVISVFAWGESTLALDEAGNLWAWGSNAYGQLGDGTTTSRSKPVAVDLSNLEGAGVLSVASGGGRVFAVDDVGRLWGWGNNVGGYLGDGTDINRYVPVAVDLSALEGTGVVSVATSFGHSYAVDELGRLWAWGSNFRGQVGDGTNVYRPTPVAVDLSALKGARVVSVTAGQYHTLALDEEGQLWAWGDNTYGMLGDGTREDRNVPVAVDQSALGGARVTAVAAEGYYRSLALDEWGRLWAWGRMGSSQFYLTPEKMDLSALEGAAVISVAVSKNHTLALDEAGRLWAWGVNLDGQLGDGSTTNRSAPVLVGALNGGAIAVSATNMPTTATITSGSNVELGTLSVTSERLGEILLVPDAGFRLGAPGQTSVTAHFGESAHTLYARCDTPGVRQVMNYSLVDDAGTLVNAGEVEITCLANIRQSTFSNGDGGLTLAFTNEGVPDAWLHFTPAEGVTLSGMTSWEGSLVQSGRQTLSLGGIGCPLNGIRELGTLEFLDSQGQIYGQKTVHTSGATCGSSLAAGSSYSITLTETGGIWAFGANSRGQLGDGTTVNRNTPVVVNLSALQGTPVASVTAGGMHTLALDEGDRLWAWGDNYYGQLGDGTTTNHTTPVSVDLTALEGARVVSVAAGSTHTLALDERGRLWAWGGNAAGQLGDGTTTNRSMPVMVDLSSLEDAGVVHMVAGSGHSLALDNVGRLWAWGNGSSGQLGNATITKSPTPVVVDLNPLDGAEVISIVAGSTHTLALDEMGRLWAWGENGLGQLGDGTQIDRYVPVAVDLSVLDGVKVVSMVASREHTLALDQEGRLWAWGSNISGMLGDGSTPKISTTPVAVKLSALEGRNVVSVAVSNAHSSDVSKGHSLVLDEEGRLWAWGDNSFGELGEGSTTSRITPVLVSALNSDVIEVLPSGVIEVMPSGVPATATIVAGQFTELGSLSVMSERLGDTTLQLIGAVFSLGSPGETRVVVPFGESTHSLYAFCNTPGDRKVFDYQLLDDTGYSLYTGQVDITCQADIGQLGLPNLIYFVDY